MKTRFRICDYYLINVPAMAIGALFFIYPIAQVARLSFYNYNSGYGLAKSGWVSTILQLTGLEIRDSVHG